MLLIILGVIGFIILLALVFGLIPAAAFVYIWRSIYPWLVRMGHWAAQLRNLVFLFFVLLAIGIIVSILAGLLTGNIVVGILAVFVTLPVFLFFLALAVVVWVVRLWRYGFPATRGGFWWVFFHVVGWLWAVLVGILRFVGWILYHPPISWIIAIGLFYLRVVSAIVAWFLYHPPLRWLAIAGIVIMQLVARLAALILYEPPIRWLAEAWLFVLRLVGWIIAIGMFCVRPIAIVAAWFLYHPPLRWLVTVSFLFVRSVSWLVSWLLYHPPLRWLAEAGFFIMKLVASGAGVVIYAPLPLLLKVAYSVRDTMREIASTLARLLNHRLVPWLVGVAIFVMEHLAFAVSWVMYELLSWLLKLAYRFKEAMLSKPATEAV